MNDNVNLPSLSSEGSLSHYLQQIKNFQCYLKKKRYL